MTTPKFDNQEAEFSAEVRRIHQQALDIMLAKRALRGTENIKQQGLGGVIDRLVLDKGARLRRSVSDGVLLQLLRERGINPSSIPQLAEIKPGDAGDSFEDDLLDVINYATIALCLTRDKW